MAKKRIIELTIAGYTFAMKNLKVHDDMSEETTCFSGDLYCNGKKIAHCSNDGRGGMTDVRYYSCDPNYNLAIEAFMAISKVRDTKFEAEMTATLKKYNTAVTKPYVQHYTDDHLAEQLMYKQSAWDDACPQIKRWAKKQPTDKHIYFNGKTIQAMLPDLFALRKMDGYEDVTEWVR